MDCGGVPNGLKKVDLCGECLLPTDVEYNTGCGVQLGSFTPNIAYYGGVEVHLDATGVENITNVECNFNG